MYAKSYKTGAVRNYVQFHNSFTKQVVTYEAAPATTLSHCTDEFIMETAEGNFSFRMDSSVYNKRR